MAVFFKKRYLPNADGSDSTTLLTNTNTAFVHTYLGDDNTGDGTREKPYRTANKALQKSGVSYVIFRGVINEYFNSNKTIIGDDLNQIVVTENYAPAINNGFVRNFTCTNFGFIVYSCKSERIIYLGNNFEKTGSSEMSYCFVFKNKRTDYLSNNSKNNTFINISKQIYNIANLYNSIVIGRVDINPSLLPNFKYTSFVRVFVSLDGVNIVMPALTGNAKNNISLLRNAFKAAGISNPSLCFPLDSFNNETCLELTNSAVAVFNKYAPNVTGTLDAPITANAAKTSITITVLDASKVPDTGDFFIPFIGTYTNNGASITDGNEVFTYTSKTINTPTSVTLNGASYTFKMPHSAGVVCTRYGDVLDYTLNPDVRNEALYASDIGGYVGCFAPAIPVNSEQANLGSIINVNSDGSDDTVTGDLLVLNSDDTLTFSSTSSQIWNRMLTSLITIAKGERFNGLSIKSQDGSPFGYYFGKYQDMMDDTHLTPSDTLEVNTWYKVCNPVVSMYNSAVFNGINYLPDYFFYSGSITSFSLQNSDSGTYLQKVKCVPLESVEVIPYDNTTTLSVSLPKFSAPLMGDCKMLYYKSGNTYGKTAGTPVLFGDAAVLAITDKISYYKGVTIATGWGVTNADWEFNQLSADTTNFYYETPALKYLKLQLNAHFSAEYDQ